MTRKRILATLDPELVAWLDSWRDRQPVRTTRSACLDEAIRALRKQEETMDIRYQTGEGVIITTVDYTDGSMTGIELEGMTEVDALDAFLAAWQEAIEADYPRAQVECRSVSGSGTDSITVDVGPIEDEDGRCNYDNMLLEQKIREDIFRIRQDVWDTGSFWPVAEEVRNYRPDHK